MKQFPIKHTLWLASWFPHKTNTLLGNFIQRQAQAVNQYAQVTVLYATQHIDNEYIIEISQEPMTVIRVYFPETQNSIIKLFRYIRAWWKGYQFMLKNVGKPSVLHLNVMYPAGIFALFLSIFYKIPLIITEHWTGYSSKKIKINFFQKFIVKSCLNKAQNIIFYSKNYGERLFNKLNISKNARNSLDKKMNIIPNVVNTDFFKNSLSKGTPTEQYLKPNFPPFCLIHVSTCDDKQKNISGILRSLAILKEKTSDFSLKIIGGSENDHLPLKKLAESQNIAAHIEFHSTKTHMELIPYLQNAHIFVLFSNYEGLPCVLLEAMSVGMPVVCTETGGMSEWINEKNGKLINIGEERALADAIFDMMTQYEKYNPTLIRQKIVETCSYEAVAKAILNCY